MKQGLEQIKKGVQSIASWFGHLIDRLTSRKFVLTVLACLTFAVNGEWGLIAATVSAFIAAEGAGDVVQRYNESKASTSSQPSVEDLATLLNDNDEDEPDRSTIVSGDVPM